MLLADELLRDELLELEDLLERLDWLERLLCDWLEREDGSMKRVTLIGPV